MADAHMAWAAGLFEGNGAITVCRGRVRLSLKMTDEETVLRFHKTVGAGKVYGPYRNRTGEKDGYARSDYWMWLAEGAEARRVAAAISPWLGSRRLDRIDEVMNGVVAA